mmetsp:Transcript_59850/g.144581  ORF Transcript_59850/g.144581 Transcript_59850/m.144581 type:complete len:480 (+) Transcript_59850:86-1525(+)
MASQELPQQRQAQAVPTVEPASDSEPGDAPPTRRPLRFKRAGAVALSCAMAALVMGLTWFRSTRACSRELGAGWAEEKLELDGEGQMKALAKKLNAVTSKTFAQKLVEKASTAAGKEALSKWKGAPARVLPNSFVQPEKKGRAQGTAVCIFNVMEAMTSAIGLGDAINGMARTCPAPRDGVGDLACEVDSGIMIAFVGTLAAKLSLAASNCAETINVDAICAAGVTGLVAALGELAAAASLAAPTCSPHPPSLPTTKISELGDKTLGGVYTGRRLVIGEGAVGNGVQCGVDVSIVAEQLANFGLAINSAVNSPNCKSENWEGNRGLVRSLCTVDIGGAVAYFAQAVTFIQLSILNCKDFLDIKALCGASIAGVATAAAAISPYGAAVHAGCTLNHEAKEATGTGRRLDRRDALARLDEVTETLRATMAELGQNASSIPSIHNQNTAPESGLKKLVSLMEPAVTEKAAFRGAGALEQECQ